jgi:hypothetical protein
MQNKTKQFDKNLKNENKHLVGVFFKFEAK